MAGETKVGFIGLGTMGGRMATNLQKAGFKLVVHDLTRQAASHHLNAGAVWADSPRAVASQVDVLFTSLPEPADVEAVGSAPTGSSPASSRAPPGSISPPTHRAWRRSCTPRSPKKAHTCSTLR